MKRTTGIVLAVVAIAQFAAHNALAADAPHLSVFDTGGSTQGLWRVEMLGSDDPRSAEKLNSRAAEMGNMGICMDAAKKMTPDSTPESSRKCSSKIIRNTSSTAELDVACEDGASMHMTVTREDSKTLLLNNVTTTKEGKTRTVKARYHYEGPCKSDALIEMDKNSPTCKKMANVDPAQMATMCTRLPAERREQCEQQMKSMVAGCK